MIVRLLAAALASIHLAVPLPAQQPGAGDTIGLAQAVAWRAGRTRAWLPPPPSSGRLGHASALPEHRPIPS